MSATTRHRLYNLPKIAIVAAILLVLVGLLTPAVFRVREAANLKLCANNLKQIGIAAYDYYSAFDKLPPGWFGPNPDSRDYLQASNSGVLLDRNHTSRPTTSTGAFSSTTTCGP
jgi:Protein of unknown function (DUF1559)